MSAHYTVDPDHMTRDQLAATVLGPDERLRERPRPTYRTPWHIPTVDPFDAEMAAVDQEAS